jgi:hypothetical protein
MPLAAIGFFGLAFEAGATAIGTGMVIGGGLRIVARRPIRPLLVVCMNSDRENSYRDIWIGAGHLRA